MNVVLTSTARILLEKNNKWKRSFDNIDKKSRGPKELKDKRDDDNGEWTIINSKPSGPALKVRVKHLDMPPSSSPPPAPVYLSFHDSTTSCVPGTISTHFLSGLYLKFKVCFSNIPGANDEITFPCKAETDFVSFWLKMNVKNLSKWVLDSRSFKNTETWTNFSFCVCVQ